MVMEQFNAAFRQLLTREDGSIDHAFYHETGTRYGLTQHDVREAGWTGAIQQLPFETARDIYYDLYWKANMLDRVDHIDPRVSFALFECAVLAGSNYMADWYANALNVLRKPHRREPLYEPLDPAGFIDLAMINAHKRLEAEEREHILVLLNCSLLIFLKSRVYKDPTYERLFLRWLQNTEFIRM